MSYQNISQLNQDMMGFAKAPYEMKDQRARTAMQELANQVAARQEAELITPEATETRSIQRNRDLNTQKVGQVRDAISHLDPYLDKDDIEGFKKEYANSYYRNRVKKMHNGIFDDPEKMTDTDWQNEFNEAKGLKYKFTNPDEEVGKRETNRLKGEMELENTRLRGRQDMNLENLRTENDYGIELAKHGYSLAEDRANNQADMDQKMAEIAVKMTPADRKELENIKGAFDIEVAKIYTQARSRGGNGALTFEEKKRLAELQSGLKIAQAQAEAKIMNKKQESQTITELRKNFGLTEGTYSWVRGHKELVTNMVNSFKDQLPQTAGAEALDTEATDPTNLAIAQEAYQRVSDKVVKRAASIASGMEDINNISMENLVGEAVAEMIQDGTIFKDPDSFGSNNLKYAPKVGKSYNQTVGSQDDEARFKTLLANPKIAEAYNQATNKENFKKALLEKTKQ